MAGRNQAHPGSMIAALAAGGGTRAQEPGGAPRRRLTRFLAMILAKYFKLFDISLQNTVVYRWNFILRTLFDVVPLLGHGVICGAPCSALRNQPVAGYDFGSMVFYFLLTLLASNLITPADDEWQIAADIREGQLNALLSQTGQLPWLSHQSSFVGNRAIHSATILPLDPGGVRLLSTSMSAFRTLGLTWLWTALSLRPRRAAPILPGLRHRHAGVLVPRNLDHRVHRPCRSSIF